MKEFLGLLVKKLVDNPDGVTVEQKDEKEIVRLKIQCDTKDLGKVIGKKGQTVGALRTIIKAIGAKELNKRAIIDIDEF